MFNNEKKYKKVLPKTEILANILNVVSKPLPVLLNAYQN